MTDKELDDLEAWLRRRARYQTLRQEHLAHKTAEWKCADAIAKLRVKNGDLKRERDELERLAGEANSAYWDIDQDGPDSPCVKLLAEKMLALSKYLFEISHQRKGGMRMATTKQISRDDVERVCESLCSPDVCCPCRDFRHDTAAMLRSLMDRVEELEAVVCVSRDALRQCPAETLEHRRDINIAKRACVEALAERKAQP